MTVALTASEYLAYSNVERAKWREWFAAHPEALCAVVQREGQLTDAGTLLCHAFTAEGWHTQRLWGETPDLPEIPVTNGAALFAYGERMRSRFEEFLKTTQQDLAVPREFAATEGHSGRATARRSLCF
jgi:hypothetical protein